MRRSLAVLLASATLVSGTTLPASAAGSLPSPKVTKVSQTSGKTSGGARITVTGVNFRHVSRVLFGSTAGSALRVRSSQSLTVLTPRRVAGRVDVRVVLRSGKVTRTSATVAADRFTFVAPPTVTGIAPAQGSTAGGQRISVRGTDFRAVRSVTVGGRQATGVRVGSSTTLSATAPAHVAGAADIRVVTAYGASAATARDRYTYYVPTLGEVNDVSCASPSFCVAVDYYSKAARFDGRSWSPAAEFTGGQQITGISCPTVSFCVAVDRSGGARTFDGRTWSARTTVAPAELFRVSCTGPAFCVAGGYRLGSPDVTWVAYRRDGRWTTTTSSGLTEGMTSVSCVSATFCAATDGLNRVLTFDGRAWSPSLANSQEPINGVSCSSATQCVAVSNLDAWAWDGAEWAGPAPHGVPDYAGGVSCPAVDTCVAFGYEGNAAVRAAGVWQTPSPTGLGDRFVAGSCSTATSCVAVDRRGQATLWNGDRWSAPIPQPTG